MIISNHNNGVSKSARIILASGVEGMKVWQLVDFQKSPSSDLYGAGPLAV